jgi:hypothetical protein
MAFVHTESRADCPKNRADEQLQAKPSGGVKLHGHPELSAKARLSAAPTASRDLGDLALPRLLRDDPAISQPFVVAPTRSGSPGLSVLELTDVLAREAVTPEEPLRHEVPATTAEGEHILPVGFDGEFFLPLGRAVPNRDGGTEIVIERLPGDYAQASLPEAARRSLGGSIKIFFQKVVCGVLGREFEYPVLAAADVDETGGKEEVVYEKDAEDIKTRVSRARKILLLIHGVLGDTLEIRRGMRRAKVGPERTPVDSLYDLVLTFDYENLNTPIEDVARKLKERLEAVGLGPDHGNELTIVAHSMGGWSHAGSSSGRAETRSYGTWSCAGRPTAVRPGRASTTGRSAPWRSASTDWPRWPGPRRSPAA